jgi:predicted CXXCH cytochrome family protein
MSRKFLVFGLLIVLLGAAFWAISAQEEEAHPIVTTASGTVGVNTYVAAQAFAIAGDEDAPEPMVYILPYGIYPDMHVLDIADFEQPEGVEGFTYVWSLEGADLVAEGTVAIFLADAEGQYTLTLTATDEAGNSAETSWVVTASTYVGAGTYTGEAEHAQCANCHADQADDWMATGHADMLVRGLEGTLSSHYGEGCISCHVTGFYGEGSGGFSDMAAASGWEFPEELTTGNWDVLVTDYPEVADMSNIQCESCHGPGLAHATEGVASNRMISVDLGYGVCAQCHAEETHHVYPQQWENSNHAEMGGAWTAEIGRQSCAKCHSGEGYIDYADGLPQEEWRSGFQTLGCASCHDPHSNENPMQLRAYGSIVLPEGEVTDIGPAATCMTCHQARRDGGAAGQVARGMEEGSMSTPHHNNNQAELMTTGGGYTFGQELPSSPHGAVVENVCSGCHMGATPGFDDEGNALPGRHEVGGHSFSMASEAAGENVVVCQDCHVGATTFEFEASRDYDGDGIIETNQEEVAGLHEALGAALTAAGVQDVDSRRFVMPENPTEAMWGGMWNYQFTAFPGTAVHNLRYSVALLQLSIEQLGGTTGEPLPAR